MKKLFVVCALVVLFSAEGCKKNLIIIELEAQSFPVTKTLAWDAAAVDANNGPADDYVVKMNGTTIGTPTTTQQQFTLPAAGSYTFTVAARNIWGISADSTLQVNARPPKAVTNPRIQ